jgi:hypothetical protein
MIVWYYHIIVLHEGEAKVAPSNLGFFFVGERRFIKTPSDQTKNTKIGGTTLSIQKLSGDGFCIGIGMRKAGTPKKNNKYKILL